MCVCVRVGVGVRVRACVHVRAVCVWPGARRFVVASSVGGHGRRILSALWMALEAGFTAARLSKRRREATQSRPLGCKMERGSPGRGVSQDITVKGSAVTYCHTD